MDTTTDTTTTTECYACAWGLRSHQHTCHTEKQCTLLERDHLPHEWTFTFTAPHPSGYSRTTHHTCPGKES